MASAAIEKVLKLQAEADKEERRRAAARRPVTCVLCKAKVPLNTTTRLPIGQACRSHKGVR